MERQIHLIRHGEPEEGYLKRFLGRLDPGLSRKGKDQACVLGEVLRNCGINRILASPLRRARETAELISAACGIPLAIDDLLLEIDFGKLEGMTFKDASSVFPCATDSWQALAGDFSFPGGENFADFTRRAETMAQKIRDSTPTGTVIVAHGGILRGILCNLLAVKADGPIRFRLAYAALTTLELDSTGSAVLTAFNVGRELPA